MELFRRIAELLGITLEEVEGLSAADIDRRLIRAGEDIDVANATDEDLALLEELGDVATEVRELAAYDDAMRADRRTQAEEAAARLRGESAEQQEGNESTDPAETTEAGEGPGAGEPGERPPSPPETGAPTSAPDTTEPAGTDAPASPTAEDRRQPVAASAPRRAPIRRAPVAREVQPQHSPIPMKRGAVRAITAAADVPGRAAGAEFSDMREVAQSMVRRWETLQSARGVDGNVPVATIASVYPEDRVIDTMDPQDTERVFDRVLSRDARIAAGGFCAPVTPVYDLATVSTADRPVRDALPSFMATRGGIRYVPPPTLADIAAESPAPVSTWSAATDASPGGSTKPCATFTCPGVSEQLLDAIPVCRQFGNFQARAFPEQVDRLMQLTMAFQARYAERKILTSIGTGSTNVSTGQLLGAARDFFAEAQKVDAQYRQRHRMSAQANLRAILPFWLRNKLRADLVRETPGDNAIAMSDEIIDAALGDLNWNVTWALDGETGQEYSTQAAGGVNPWIANVVWYLFHEGAWVFLDGGTLDIGLVRDSTLNAKNNFQIFSETFEQVVFRGVESLRVTSTLCASGASAIAIATSALCTSGS